MTEGGDFSGGSRREPVSLKASSEVGVSGELSANAATGRAPSAVLACPTLMAREVSVGFGSKTVVSNVNLEFHPGTITALIGPTCGRSTG